MVIKNPACNAFHYSLAKQPGHCPCILPLTKKNKKYAAKSSNHYGIEAWLYTSENIAKRGKFQNEVSGAVRERKDCSQYLFS